MMREQTWLVVLAVIMAITTLVASVMLILHFQGWIKLPFDDQRVLMINSAIVTINALVVSVLAWLHRKRK